MNTYLIADAGGNLAHVEGADQRDVWTKVRGWHEVTEPRPSDQVYIWRDGIEAPGRVPYEALDGWVARGWRPGPPPEPVDITKDPVLVDQPPAAVAPAKPKTQAAAGGDKSKE